jgi:hypothetical protein
MRPLRRLVLALSVACPAAALPAQQPAAARAVERELRVFLDCRSGGCDFDYVRTESPWLAFVRDRTAADVHLLVTRLGTGAGGSEYTLAFVGTGTMGTRSDTLRLVTEPGQTDQEVRQALTRTIQLGLVPWVMRTPQRRGLRLSFDQGGAADEAASPASDPWRAWVFEVGADVSAEREQQQNELDLDGEFEARRVTDLWKFGVSASGSFTRDRFRIEERTVTNLRESYSGGAVIVHSLGDHWGAGAQVSLSSSTFQNTRLAVRAAPAVEYSLWPYAQATRRQLTLQYSVGVSAFEYREETIFDRLQETRPTQSFVAGYDVRQPWGSVDVELEAASFLDDARQFRLEFDSGMNLRLFRGFSLQVGGSASLIRDQLSLVKRDATPEEILLERRALATDYRYDLFVGFNYTFGSIFNSVVNPRFGTGPGQILR